MDERYHFDERIAQGELDDAARGWLRAVRFGFNEKHSAEENLQRWWATCCADRTRLRWVQRAPQMAGLGLDEVPVATLASLTRHLNVGEERLDCHYITDVTVRATDRRRGLLRRLITDDLTAARESGLAVASLTASEGGIYGRFGFGVAITRQRVDVDTGLRFVLRPESAQLADTCQVEQADPLVCSELVQDLHRRFLASFRGAHQTMNYHASLHSGEWDWETMAPHTGMRAALAFVDDEPRGAVSYLVEDQTARVVDLVALDGAAELALWRYLAGLDLVDTVRFANLQEGSALRPALVDHRVVNTVAESDQIWLRLLDVPAALLARGWEHDGQITLAVTDPLELSPGCWTLTIRDGQPTLEPAERTAAQVTLGIDALAELYLGTAPAPVLASAGRIAGDPAAVGRLGRMFAVTHPAANLVFF
ncbi:MULTISPECIES: GNAT family N-acetyltransferase [unclassified Luteococcus]|uniref:GNAT family N-acetyltransferase n=1 Tax=unclassified Luteococcus TaxID=2639923 RepID=UPI00313F17DE